MIIVNKTQLHYDFKCEFKSSLSLQAKINFESWETIQEYIPNPVTLKYTLHLQLK